MIKLSLVVLGSLLISAITFADDTGIPAINVSDMKISSVKGYGDEMVRKPVKKEVRILAEFDGKEAKKLMKILPSENYVLADDSYRKNIKVLEVIGKNQGMVIIRCKGGEAVQNGEKTSVLARYKTGPKCSISIENIATNSDAMEGTQDFTPACEEQ